MSPIVVGILGIALMIGIIFLGMNIGLAMFFIGFLGFAYMTSFDTAMGVMRTVPYTNASSYSLSVVPSVRSDGDVCLRFGDEQRSVRRFRQMAE
jgi:hypothetical protein